MGDFDKKKRIAFGSIGAAIVIIIGVMANMTQIAGFFEGHKKKSADEPQKVIEQNIDEEKEIPAELPAEITPEPATEANYVWLDKMPITESEHCEVCDIAEDTVGNKYTGHIVSAISHYYYNPKTYAKYYLGGKYKTFSGTIAVESRSNAECESTLNIYADDTLIYSTDEIGRDTAPFEINLDVSGYEWLKFDIIRTYTNRGTNFIFYNCKLEK